MAARLLPGTTTRVRRGRRDDFAHVQAVLGQAGGDRAERLYHRMMRDLGTDLYVAEEEGGTIVAVIALAYGRSLADTDGCNQQTVVDAFKEGGYSIKQLLLAITQSDGFLYRPAQ